MFGEGRWFELMAQRIASPFVLSALIKSGDRKEILAPARSGVGQCSAIHNPEEV